MHSVFERFEKPLAKRTEPVGLDKQNIKIQDSSIYFLELVARVHRTIEI